MPRYALKIEYLGTPFCGWQRQRGQPSVQAALEGAVARIDPAAPLVTGAGRTDTGVHASGQVAHLDLTRDWQPHRLAGALNAHLRPAPVGVVQVVPVPGSFHARFSAIERRYTYRLFARQTAPVLLAGQVWHLRRVPDVQAMRAGAEHLIGRHDFSTFRAALCQADSPVRTLDQISIEQIDHCGGTELRLHFRARSFLHNQVRSIVGTLERVGQGDWPPEQVAQALEARNRAACGPVAPPQGLCLTGVGYPDDPFKGA